MYKKWQMANEGPQAYLHTYIISNAWKLELQGKRERPTNCFHLPSYDSIDIQSVSTVKLGLEPRQFGIRITSKTIYSEGNPLRIYSMKIIIGNTPVVKISNLTEIISFLIKRMGNPFH